jgi:very-short-patch-repair endonuclease
MKKTYACAICGKIWNRLTLRMEQGKTCSKKCASIKGYLSGDRKETGIELKLQSLLLALDIEFETQKPILGVTIADVFILPNVAIFADGAYWHGDPMTQYKDAEKTKRLRRAGYIVLRLDEEEIEEDAELVKSKLLEAYNCRRITKKL